MKQAAIISVDPGVKTLGELNINEHRLAALSRSLTDTSSKSSSKSAIPNLLFGINGRTSSDFSSKISMLRLVAGIMIIASVILPSATSFPASHTALLCALGLSVMFGVFTRIAGLASAAVLGSGVLASLSSGALDLTSACFASIALIFAVLGPGRYSCDFYLRNALRKLMATKKQTPAAESELDYRAYNNIDSRLRY